MIEITKGNISTFACWAYTIIGPSLIAYGVDQEIFTSILIIVVGILLNIYSSYNPNTISFLGNAPDEEVGEESDVSQ